MTFVLLFAATGCHCSKAPSPEEVPVEEELEETFAFPTTPSLTPQPGSQDVGDWCSQGEPVAGFPSAGQAIPTDSTLSFPPPGEPRSFLIKRLPRFMEQEFQMRLPMAWDPAGVPLPWEAVGYPGYDWQPEMDSFSGILQSSLAVDQPYFGYVNLAWGGKFIECNGYQASDWSRIERDGSIPTYEVELDTGTETMVGVAHWSREAYQECFIESLVAGTRAGVSHWFFDDPFVNVPSSFHQENLSAFNAWLGEQLTADEIANDLGIDLATFNYAELDCDGGENWCPMDRLWEIFQILELQDLMERTKAAANLAASDVGNPPVRFGFNALPSAQFLQFSATVQDIGMSELPGILYQGNSHLAFYRVLESIGTTLFPIKPPLMYLDQAADGDRSIRFTPENRIVTSEVLMSDALSYVYPGRFTSTPYTTNHFESEDETPLLKQIEPEVRPVYWASQHYCGELVAERITNTLLLWSMASEPSPAGTLLNNQYISIFNAVGQALDRQHIPYHAQVVGDRFFGSYPDLQAEDLEAVSMVVLPAVGILSDSAKELLVQFVSEGGHVIAVGRAGGSNPFGLAISDTDQPQGWADLFSVESGQHQGGSGLATTMAWPEEPCQAEEARWNFEEERDTHTVCLTLRNQVENALIAQADLDSLQVVDATLPDGIVLDALTAGDDSLILKLHNRNFNDETILAASGSVSISLDRLPTQYEVSWFEIGNYAEPLDHEVSGENLIIQIPEFTDFALLRIGTPIAYREFEFEPIAWRSDQER